MFGRYLTIATLLLVADAAPAQKSKPNDDIIVKGKRLDDDIIVEGSRKTLAAGLWSIQAGPGMMTVTQDGTRQTSQIPAFRWKVCLPGDRLATQMSRLLIEGAAIGCSPIRFRQRGDRIIADFACSARQTDEDVDYSGSATSRSVDLRVSKTAEFSAMTPSGPIEVTRETQSRLFANRLGECTVAGANPPPTIRNPVFTASVHPRPLGDDLPGAPEVMPRGIPIGEPVHPDDIVVVARKLMKLRLRYASDGRILTNCSNTRPSGDVRIDRIGCAVLKACVASGSEANGSTLACFNNRIMSLVPAVHAAPVAQYRGKNGYIER